MDARTQWARAWAAVVTLFVAAVFAGCSCAGGDEPVPGAGLTGTDPASAPASTLPADPGEGDEPTTTSATAAGGGGGGSWTPPTVRAPGAAEYEVLFSVPAAEGDDIEGATVGYEGLGIPDLEPVGPTALAVAPDGTVWLADLVGIRLLGFTPEGELTAEVDLTGYQVAAVADVAAGAAGPVLLDMYPAQRRYRVLELDSDGGLRAVHVLPGELGLEAGLSGIALGPQDELWVELEGGARVAALTGPGGAGRDADYALSSGYPYPKPFGPVAGEPFSYDAGGVTVRLPAEHTMGGVTLLGVNPDGSYVLEKDEVWQGGDGRLRVAVTVHLVGSDGAILGAGRFPLSEQALTVEHPLTLGPDGYVYALLSRSDGVDVARLAYMR